MCMEHVFFDQPSQDVMAYHIYIMARKVIFIGEAAIGLLLEA